MNKVVGVQLDDGVEWHAVNTVAGDYDTMCGVDANDPCIGHHGTVEAKKGQKITCQDCYNLWKGVTQLRLKESMFQV